MEIIARIYNAFEGKFGVPRQSGLVENILSDIVFEPQYRVPEALRGLEEFSHLWLIWAFDRNNSRAEWRPTVRPPRLGGNRRIGVFATRSPYRPNPIGLSCVRLTEIVRSNQGPVLRVAGADLVNGTPIYDIKPYLPYTDCRPEAVGGFTDTKEKRRTEVWIPEKIRTQFDPEELKGLTGILREDPRPAYQEDPDREYAFGFAGRRVTFSVRNGVLTVLSAEAANDNEE